MKRILITGVNGQLGQEIARSFLTDGYEVYGADIQERCSFASNKPGQFTYLSMNVVNREQVSRVFGQIFSQVQILDVLVNNAGVAVFEHFLDRSDENFDHVTDVNLKGTFHCIQAYAKQMIDRQAKGSVINIGSIYGVVSPDPRVYTDCARNSSEIYGATKAGVVQMTKYFAVHLAQQGIRVNCVSPGGILNPANPQGSNFVANYSNRCPMGRMAEAWEMIGAIRYFASADLSSYTTGQNLVVDGGLSAW